MVAYPAYRLEHIDRMPFRQFLLLLREIPRLHNAQIARMATATLMGSTPQGGEHIADLLND